MTGPEPLSKLVQFGWVPAAYVCVDFHVDGSLRGTSSQNVGLVAGGWFWLLFASDLKKCQSGGTSGAGGAGWTASSTYTYAFWAKIVRLDHAEVINVSGTNVPVPGLTMPPEKFAPLSCYVWNRLL